MIWEIHINNTYFIRDAKTRTNLGYLEKLKMTQEELSKYMALIEYYKEQINNLELQSSYVQNAINDYNRAKITLEQMKKVDKNSEILMPIGGSTFVYATNNNPGKVLFDIGSGIVTEKTTNDAVKNIDKRVEDLQKTIEKITSMIQQMQDEAAGISAKAEQMLSEQQKQ